MQRMVYRLAGTMVLLCAFLGMAIAEEKKAVAFYQEIGPNFLINLRPSNGLPGGFLQARVEVMVRSQAELDAVKLHVPYLRNDLVMLFSSKTKEQLLRADGQHSLRRQALTILRKRMQKEEPSVNIEKVLFTQVLIE